ncbi:MAG: hypothetical protein ABR522_15520 [Marinobacter sp.]
MTENEIPGKREFNRIRNRKAILDAARECFRERGLLPDIDQEYLCAAFFGVGYELSLRLARRARRHPDEADAKAKTATRFATNLFLNGLKLGAPLP